MAKVASPETTPAATAPKAMVMVGRFKVASPETTLAATAPMAMVMVGRFKVASQAQNGHSNTHQNTKAGSAKPL
jgi:hypothetical protein